MLGVGYSPVSDPNMVTAHVVFLPWGQDLQCLTARQGADAGL